MWIATDDQDDFLILDEGDDEDLTPRFKGWKVLVVDDEPDIRIVSRAGLRTTRFADAELTILEAASAREARQKVEEHPDVAVILLDVVMENPTAGLDFARWLQSRPASPRPRVLLRTGQPGMKSAHSAQDGLALHAYLEKTDVTVERLRAAVVDALSAYASERAH
jgi:CheY-like chemotaxis protein